jgi:hypothetical protein
MKVIRCDGGCRTEWPETDFGSVRGPAIEITRVDGLGGGGYRPDTADSVHLCRECAAVRLAWTVPQEADRG